MTAEKGNAGNPNEYLTIQFGPQILKMDKNPEICPISNLVSVKSIN